MQLVEQYWEWVKEPEEWIEIAGRTCYKSEDKITPDSSEKFIRMLRNRKHFPMIEHSVASVRFITNRGFTHELVRHRLASYAQESTRYVRYGDVDIIIPTWWNWMEPLAPIEIPRSTFPNLEQARDFAIKIIDEAEIKYGTKEVIGFDKDTNEEYSLYEKMRRDLIAELSTWLFSHMVSEWSYCQQLDLGSRPEKARGVLPQDLKTEIVMTCNFVEWYHVFSLRADTPAHPQIREMMKNLLQAFNRKMPAVFEDLHGTLIQE